MNSKLTFTEKGMQFLQDLEETLQHTDRSKELDETNMRESASTNRETKIIPPVDEKNQSPQKQVQLFRHEILNSKHDQKKLLSILLPDILKSPNDRNKQTSFYSKNCNLSPHHHHVKQNNNLNNFIRHHNNAYQSHNNNNYKNNNEQNNQDNMKSLINDKQPHLLKQKAYSFLGQNNKNTINNQNINNNSEMKISGISKYIINKMNMVQNQAQEEEIKQQRKYLFDLRQNQQSPLSPKTTTTTTVTLKTKVTRDERSPINFTSSLENSPDILTLNKQFYQYQSPKQSKINNNSNINDVDSKINTFLAHQTTYQKTQGYYQDSILDCIDDQESSKLTYMSARLDKIYKKHSLQSQNQDIIQNKISQKHKKIIELASLDNNTLDLKYIKSKYKEEFDILKQDFKIDEERRKQNLIDLHKTKYLDYWKGIFIGNHHQQSDKSIFNHNINKNSDLNNINKNNQNNKKKILSQQEQDEINRMKMLFNMRS